MKKDIDFNALLEVKYNNEEDLKLMQQYPWVLEDMNDEGEDDENESQ